MSDKIDFTDFTILGNLIEKHGLNSGKKSNIDKNAIWTKIAKDYNQETGATKIGKRLQGSWNSHQNRLKTKQSKIEAGAKQTGSLFHSSLRNKI